MTSVGYARVSTGHQNLSAQHDAFEAAGCERVFTDQLSGVVAERPGLAGLLDYVRPGDTVVVTTLNRLNRSLSGVIATIETLTAAEVLLKSSREGIDYVTATGEMLAGIFASLAGYERELMHERAAAARVAARARGRRTGRPPRLNAEPARTRGGPLGPPVDLRGGSPRVSAATAMTHHALNQTRYVTGAGVLAVGLTPPERAGYPGTAVRSRA